MPILSRRSYAETVEGRRRFLSKLKILLIVFLSYEVLVSLFVSAFSISSVAMEPTFYPGENILASPFVYGPETIFGKFPPPVRPKRGDVVLVKPPYAERPSFWIGLADSIVRFLTFQRLSIVGPNVYGVVAGPFIERVIALPGDTVEMEDFVFKVKKGDSEHFLTEFELSTSRYDTIRPDLPSGWTNGLPLSGFMAPRILGKDEYFVACDNRMAASDSRLWGPIGIDRFKAKAFLRYWPFGHFGLP